MIRTITVAAYRRPDYLKQVLESLKVALENCPEYAPERIVIGVDPAPNQAKVIDTARCLDSCALIAWPDHLGVDEHPRRLLQYAFEELHSDFNLHLEDDTVPSPDALRLACWYHMWHAEDYNQTLCVMLCSNSVTSDQPEAVVKRSTFTPWGWGCIRRQWIEWLAPNWNSKRERPTGWDWSISRLMSKHRLTALAPVLSRVHNIGRTRGQYQTPEGYDRDFGKQVFAGESEMRSIEEFAFDPKEPEREEWKHGD